MSWVDLEEGILEEFTAQSRDYYAPLAYSDFASAYRVCDGPVIAKARLTDRYERGLCRSCSHDRQPNKIRCRRCETYHSKWKSAHYRTMLANGFCRCGNYLAPKGKRCIECQEDDRANHNAQYRKRKLRGDCVECGVKSDRPGFAYCSRCLEKQAIRWRTKYSPTRHVQPVTSCAVCQGEVRRKSDTCSRSCGEVKRQRALIADGKCVRCQGPGLDGYKLCKICKGKRDAHNAKRLLTKRTNSDTVAV